MDFLKYESYVSIISSHGIPSAGSGTMTLNAEIRNKVLDTEQSRVNHKNGDVTIKCLIQGNKVAVRFYTKRLVFS